MASRASKSAIQCLSFLHHLVKSLDGSQGHAVGVERGDVAIIRAKPKRGVEILCHGADVTDRRSLGLVASGRDGQLGQVGKDFLSVDWGEILLRIAVAGIGPLARLAQMAAGGGVDKATLIGGSIIGKCQWIDRLPLLAKVTAVKTISAMLRPTNVIPTLLLASIPKQPHSMSSPIIIARIAAAVNATSIPKISVAPVLRQNPVATHNPDNSSSQGKVTANHGASQYGASRKPSIAIRNAGRLLSFKIPDPKKATPTTTAQSLLAQGQPLTCPCLSPDLIAALYGNISVNVPATFRFRFLTDCFLLRWTATVIPRLSIPRSLRERQRRSCNHK